MATRRRTVQSIPRVFVDGEACWSNCQLTDLADDSNISERVGLLEGKKEVYVVGVVGKRQSRVPDNLSEGLGLNWRNKG